MILSRSADYALRAMIYLARNPSSQYVALTKIATEMRTPPFLLGRLMQRLVKGDLLQSMKGHHGGFRLARDPATITAQDIVRLIDGPFTVFDCSGDAPCGLAGDCPLICMMERAERALGDVFASVTLQTLAHAPGTPAEVRIHLQRRSSPGGGR